MKKVPFLLSFTLILSLSIQAQDIELQLVKSGYSRLLGLEHSGDDRLFTVEQNGLIEILNPDGTVNPTPFLDLSSIITPNGERGLLGLAFHPDYVTNGFFYVNYINTSGNTQISRYTVSTNPDVADASSALPIIDYTQPFSNHNGGAIKFGPDGYLYIASGDGGSGGDPGNRSQNINTLLGKLLRIDVDNPSGGNNYGIPADNPFAGAIPGSDEIWAYGLRNPWRFSFDVLTNELWIADVGQNAVEEINKVSATEAGLNYGWRCYEGTAPFNNESTCPDESELTFPFAEYDHPAGFSITGGYVYRGTDYPNLQGLYFFADFATSIIGTVDSSGTLTNLGNFENRSWSSFGQGPDNELYILDFDGSIYKLTTLLSGNDNNVLENAISIFPNPATDSFTIGIENDRISTVSISDLKGSILINQSVNDKTETIDINNLTQGIYLVTITNDGGASATKKLIIE